jgi:hypothetical protein
LPAPSRMHTLFSRKPLSQPASNAMFSNYLIPIVFTSHLVEKTTPQQRMVGQPWKFLSTQGAESA